MNRINTFEELRKIRDEKRLNQELDERTENPIIFVGMGTCGIAAGAREVLGAIRDEVEKPGTLQVSIVQTGCIGLCAREPLVEVKIAGKEKCVYEKVDEEKARQIVRQHIIDGQPVKEWIIENFDSSNFFKRQERIVLRNCGRINPEDIYEYIKEDGYQALAKVLSEMTPAQVIECVKNSGLRGRGGAGFPTGLKWQYSADVQNDQKYVVCNADEGDPGAFMDRSTLEGDPHSVLEGMAIAGYAIGANKGWFYIRAEYPLAIQRLLTAIKQAKETGLLGENILGSKFSFDIELRYGAGAFVCGEETALIASMEGRRGEPRPRPPFPAVSGLWGKPTVINNVETLANIPSIILNGPEWFKCIGTQRSKGTKVFALAGKVKSNGLVEVPMGIPLGEIVFDIGGGISRDKKFKAVQTGGPSGGCLPVEYLNTPVDYESLAELGTIMGSGGLIVMDEDTCMVDLAKFFLEFIQEESCGKCVPCRIGTKRILEVLERITRGEGREGDLDILIELCNYVKESALCGLGQTAPNPVLSTIRYFRNEYEAHLCGKCPASVCSTLFISPCQNSCPAGVDVPRYIDHIRNGRFKEAYLAIKVDNPLPGICGRVCHHPCESKCRRDQLDEPLAIRLLKRYACDEIIKDGAPLPVHEPSAPNDKKVAIVGSGPAGLTAAYFLALKGYKVTVFEALPVVGGMLAVGIPEYRLPREVLRAEVESIRSVGVDFRTNTPVGDELTIEKLKNEGYQAIFIAVGMHVGQKMNVPGEELEGVYSSIELLRQVNLGTPPDIRGKKVVVIGGGNAAVDAARTAGRLGARSVEIIYRRRREDMPAMGEEIEQALEEGIKLTFLAAPARIEGESGRVVGLTLQRMKLDGFDSGGRRRPVPDGTEYNIPADLVISAIGQSLQWPGGADKNMLARSETGTFLVEARTLMTNLPGVFAGGDCVTGPATAVEAIAAGKRAASMIDRQLGGGGRVTPQVDELRKISGEILEEETPRQKERYLAASERSENFKEVQLGLAGDAAMAEARRCLRCDIKE